MVNPVYIRSNNQTPDQAMTTNVLPIPKNMHLTEQGQQLELGYRWFKFKYLAAAILAPLFAWFLVNSDYVRGDFQELTLQVIAIMIAWIIVEYYCLAKILNYTRIDVSHDKITVTTRPVPFRKEPALARQHITQLYVAKHRIGKRNYPYYTTYQVNAILTDGKVVTLISRLKTAAQGQFIEHKMEDFLGIEDVPVDGEETRLHS